MPYFRHFQADADPASLCVPSNQFSTPWGAPNLGPCDKCGGAGSASFRCLSCAEEGASTNCPACDGRVEYVATCPVCGGDGEVTEADTVRPGVSVFPTMVGLYRYLAERDADVAGSVIVELEGDLGDLPDLDADSGALLVHPREITTRHRFDRERFDGIRRRLQREAA